ncbi:RTA1 like protein [Aspergillus sclerotiicarbonarius CBS 121057]|uniref:RTA1 like protein n=1 Tax=Aspergillus sclerotiicarbonarius (strain CBS 121057 / IBT 28362) TaxID=1448318 RepID=A0A319FIN4_ASPSB|nr:RTA1 like protein [Aspergillus sclerotiicarbonarius CBS 121057]
MVMSKYMGTYNYEPSYPAAIVFAVFFGITTLAHGIQLFWTKTWFFVAFFIGGLFEVIGYISRAISANEAPNYSITPGTIQTVFILIAPSLFAASIYMELGRIIIMTGGEQYAIVRPSWITKIFLIGDVVSFVAQAGGAASLEDSFESGERMIKIGLGVQVSFFGLFMITAAIFHYRLRPNTSRLILPKVLPWEKHMLVLYGTSLLIFVRSIFRLAEYTGGESSPLLQHEYYVYIFDAVLMLFVMGVFNAFYPAQINEALRARQVELANLSTASEG